RTGLVALRTAKPADAFGRFEADRPNELWVGGGAEPCAASLCGPPAKIFTFCGVTAEFFHYSRQKARNAVTELVKNSNKFNGATFQHLRHPTRR
ncbi:hypothetical protein, partial [Streptomyces sp. NPDC005476]|uniref:hypothetical protein n=1 Tax=Streptomyces sp. NPDC005476 TaxID=3156882 RepID=UPI00345200F8